MYTHLHTTIMQSSCANSMVFFYIMPNTLCLLNEALLTSKINLAGLSARSCLYGDEMLENCSCLARPANVGLCLLA